VHGEIVGEKVWREKDPDLEVLLLPISSSDPWLSKVSSSTSPLLDISPLLLFTTKFIEEYAPGTTGMASWSRLLYNWIVPKRKASIRYLIWRRRILIEAIYSF
jgi:hypothetical protein